MFNYPFPIENITNYFDDESQIGKLFIWEIINRKSKNLLTIAKNSFNIIKLKLVKVIPGFFNHEITKDNLKNNENDDDIIIESTNDFVFLTNENLIAQNTKYLYSKKAIVEKTSQLFILAPDSIVAFNKKDDEDDQDFVSKMWTANFKNFTSISNLHPNLMSVKILDKKVKPLKNIEKITLEFPNTLLGQQFLFNGDLINTQTNEIIENINLNLEIINDEELDFIAVNANPITVRNNWIELYFSTLNYAYNLSLTSLFDLINPNLNNKIDVFNYLDRNQKAVNLINDLIEVTEKITSGFVGMNSLEIKNWKENKTSASDPAQYNDFKIQQFVSEMENSGNQPLANKIKSFILALSKQIKSSYCWKGGLTDEHKLGLSWFVIEINGSYYLKSQFYNFTKSSKKLTLQNKIVGLINGNILPLNEKVISMPIVSDTLQEQDLSNTPLDFNAKSYNFNYLFWIVVQKNQIFDFFKNEFNLKKQTEKFTTEIQGISDNYRQKIVSDKNLQEELLRKRNNVPKNAILNPSSLKTEVTINWTLKPGSWDQYDIESYNVTISGYFIVEIVEELTSNWPLIIFNELQFKQFLDTKQIFQWIKIDLKLSSNLTKLNWKIKQINQITIFNIFGQKIFVTLNSDDKQSENYEIILLSSLDKRLTTTNAYFNYF